jgi:tetratricopeptide (TPR) repeat protein
MAEGVFDGIIGGEDEPLEEAAAAETLIEADAFAAAVAADQAKHDPNVARATQLFLEKQARLIDVQTRHVEAEHPLRMSHLRNQSMEGKLRRVGQRIRISMQVFIALVVTVLGLGLLIMLHDAFTSRSVVVDAFQAPQALASRGLTGDVVAAGVLDALQKLQDATRSVAKGLDTRGAWSSDVKIDVPETGISIGEINRLLHERFGHDLHIDGDLVQTESGGLALTVRGDGVPAKTFQGAATDLDKLTTEAAEYVYGRSQPFRYATYLIDSGRYDDALAFFPGAYARAPETERAEYANSWGNTYASLYKPAEALEKYRLALTLKPRFWKTWGNLVGVLAIVYGEEAAWREGRAMQRAADSAPASDRPTAVNVNNFAIMSQDFPLQLASSTQDAAFNQGAGASATIEGPAIADEYANLHDPVHAAQWMTLSDPDDSLTKSETFLLPAYAALDRHDVAAAIPPLQTFWKAWLADPNLQYTYNTQGCLLGLAYGLTGRMAEADAVFKRVGNWAICTALHGDALEHAGDLAGAERLWADGIRVGPDLSPVYLHRGISEMNRGDFAHAGADLATASAKSPHWADTWKAWGDLLAREGRWKQAVAKYDEALKYAPAWTALHAARRAASAHH